MDASGAPVSGSKLPLPARMARFLRERFPLEVHGASILIFFLTNSAVAQVTTNREDAPIAFGLRSLVAAVVLSLMFLRLRLFDEVKDYEHDRVHNPRRPLPRGLLTPREVNLWAAATAVVEGALSAALGPAAVGAFLLVLAFTLLMRFEFFCRDLIRSRLLTYALIHTPSGGLIGLFVFCAVTGVPLWQAPRAMLYYVLAGWSLLMVFELARKTYDPATEPGPDTYSSVFGARGAALLNAALVMLSTLLIWATAAVALQDSVRKFSTLLWGLTAVVLSIDARYYLDPRPETARYVRFSAQAYLGLASLLLALELILARGLALRAGG